MLTRKDVTLWAGELAEFEKHVNLRSKFIDSLNKNMYSGHEESEEFLKYLHIRVSEIQLFRHPRILRLSKYWVCSTPVEVKHRESMSFLSLSKAMISP